MGAEEIEECGLARRFGFLEALLDRGLPVHFI